MHIKVYSQSVFPGMCENFGQNGYASAGLTGSVTVNDVVTISGKNYVVGHISNRGKDEGFVLRLNSDFSIDRTFNNGKAWFTNNTGVNETIHSVALTTQGRIVLGGKAGNYGQLYMITTGGAFVSTFNSGGKLTLAYLTGISQVLPNGTGVYVFGFATADQTLLYSTVTAAGVWSSFNTPFHRGSSTAIKVLTEAGGAKYIAFCQGAAADNIETPSVLKIKPNGIIDSTFGVNGLYERHTGGDCTIKNIRFAEDNKLLVGVRTDGFFEGFALLKILPAGTPDDTWQTVGMGSYYTEAMQHQKLNDFIIDAEQNVWVFGDKTINGTLQPEVLRVDALGDLDKDFTFNALYPPGSNGGTFSKVIPVSGGRYAAFGTFSFSGTDRMFATEINSQLLATGTRYLPVLPPDLAINGIASGKKGFYVSSRQAVELPNTQSLFLTKFNNQGIPDADFGTGGTFTGGTSLPVSYPSIIEDPSGNVWLGGTNTKVTYDNFSFLKLTPAGIPDPSFGDDGIVSIHIGPAAKSNTFKDMELLSDGSILASGNANIDAGSYVHVALAKLNPDGTLHTGFGANGTIIHKLCPIHDFVSDIEPDHEGNIYVTGSSHLGWRRPYVIRLKEDGSLDSSFAVKGVATFLGPDSLLGGLKIKRQSNGNFVLLCYSADPAGSITELATVVGMKPDGSINTAFGDNGFFSVGEQANTKIKDADLVVTESGHIVISGMHHNGSTWVSFVYVLDADGQRTDYNGNGVRTNIPVTLESNHLLVHNSRILLAVDLTGHGSNPGAVCLDAEGILGSPLGNKVYDQAAGRSEIILYPNPAGDIFHVNKDSRQAEIVNMTGKTVLKITLSKDVPVDISMLPPGVYALRLQDAGKAVVFIKR